MADIVPLSNEQAKQLCKEPDNITKDFIFQQTMYRIKDPKVSLPFYTGVLGMRLLQKLDFPEMKFSLYFMGFEAPADIIGDLGSKERTQWAMGRKATVELTQDERFLIMVVRVLGLFDMKSMAGGIVVPTTDFFRLMTNWGTENDPDCKYHNGNSDPRGFGHIGLMVPDVEKACETFEKNGVEFVKRPQDGKMKGLAFIKDPDGYWIEIFNDKVTAQIAH